MESIIIAIVIGIIASVTNRMKENNEKPAPNRRRPAPSEAPKKPASKHKTPPVKPAAAERTEEVKPASRQQPVRETVGRLERTANQAHSRGAKIKTKASEPGLNLGEADLVNGIILSEILAPPKSRRKK